MTRCLKCRIGPKQSPYTGVLQEHKPVRCGRETIDLLAVEEPHAVVYFGPNSTSGQYSQLAGTQRKTSPATATWQTDGNDR